MKKKYIITVINPTAYREYEASSRSAMRAAEQFGRREGGERVTVWTRGGKAISQVVWSPEDGGRYLRVAV